MKNTLKKMAGDQNYIKVLRVLVKMRKEFQELMNEARIKGKEKQK